MALHLAQVQAHIDQGDQEDHHQKQRSKDQQKLEMSHYSTMVELLDQHLQLSEVELVLPH